MFKQKRILSFLAFLAAVLLLTTLCGCGEEEAALPTTAGSNASGIVLPDATPDATAIPAPAATAAPSPSARAAAQPRSTTQPAAPSNAADTGTGQAQVQVPPAAAELPQSTAAAVPTAPAEPAYNEAAEPTPQANTCTLLISCATVLSHTDQLPAGMLEVLPSDGMILPETEVTFEPGDSAFDVLQRETRERGIHMEYNETPAFQSCYIEGIANLYEFDCGPNSGWQFRVNGEFLGYGSSEWEVQSGDRIEFLYTCDMGRDLGAPQVE